MILSNVEIQSALNDKRLIIEPEPTPRRPSPGADCPYQTSSVDLTLGDEVSYFKSDAAFPVNVDLRVGKFADLFHPWSERRAIKPDQPFTLEPNRLVLARTHEKVTFPLDSKEPLLAARVEGKSSYARCGLLVHFTAPTIHAGFSGTITLELINLGPLKINLYPRMPICQLIVEEVKGVPFRNDSQFQGQTQAGGGKGAS